MSKKFQKFLLLINLDFHTEIIKKIITELDYHHPPSLVIGVKILNSCAVCHLESTSQSQSIAYWNQ